MSAVRPRHIDPSPAGDPFAPKPHVGRDANPRLSDPLGQNRVTVPEGATLQARKRDTGGVWSTWSDLAGDEFEFRLAPKLCLNVSGRPGK